MNNKLLRCFAPILTAAALAASSAANAASTFAVISDTGVIGTAHVVLGIWDFGNLDVSRGVTTNGGTSTFNGTAAGPGSVGTAFRFPDGSLRDANSPGCLCEGWGVSGNGVISRASVDDGGLTNLTLDSFTSTPTSAVSSVHLTSLAGLTVTQDYHLSASPSLFEDTVTITNTTGATITDVRYRRVMDWDVPPTEFNELVTHGGVVAALGVPTFGSPHLIESCDNGFENVSPLGGCSSIRPGTHNTDFVDSGPADHGSSFNFGFGDIPAGGSTTFRIFYGAAGSEAAALAALTTVGAEVFSLGQCNPASTACDGVTFIFGFAGVGGTVIGAPEPASLALVGLGLSALAIMRRRKAR